MNESRIVAALEVWLSQEQRGLSQWRRRESLGPGGETEGWDWLQRPKLGVDCNGGRGVTCDIHMLQLQRPAGALSGNTMIFIFGQNAAVSSLLIIPKCGECQEPVKAAIFPVLAHWWNPWEISQATPSKKSEATDQRMTVGVPEFVLAEWLPPKEQHLDWLLSGGKIKG